LKRSTNILFIIILVILAFSLWAIFPIDGERFGRNGFSLGLDLKGGSHLVYEADLSKKDPSQSDADVMAGVRDKIERRVNAYGVAEATVQQKGTNGIIVQLPGIKNVDEAIKLIGQTAELNFREQKLDASGNPVLDEEGNPEWEVATATDAEGVSKELTGKYLKPNAQVVIDPQTNTPEVAFEFNSEGAALFEKITTRLLQKRLGIFLDNELISAPVVQAVIKDKGVITGVSLEEGRNLAIQLNSGALDVPLKLIQQMDVNATLGADSLRKSLIAGAIGILMIILFMLIYYRVPGLLAICALIIYAAISMTIFKLIPITLTLPGIAGFIISIGMAVDANVLIFERMKEELRAKRPLGKAVEEGFRRAWPSIRDSNISTFITCIILYIFGDTFGAFMVKGFAVTLFIGVAVSMFSAITITRTFLRMLVRSNMVTNLAAYGTHLVEFASGKEDENALKPVKLPNFVSKRNLFFIISAIIIIPGIISLAVFRLNPGVDFSSGTAMTLSFSTEVQEDQLRQSLSGSGYSDAVIQRSQSGDYIVRIKEINTDEKTKILENMKTDLGKEPTVLDYYTVSPVVAVETGRNAVIAVIAASVFILLYIAFAFRKVKNSFKWGTCAVIALVHDVLFVTGIFSFLGWIAGVQIDALFITGMLTVVGFSVHDTIVVFDRIRENTINNISKDIGTTVNFSILQTLARSLNTSLLVIFVIMSILLIGGSTTFYFMLVLLLGIMVGTYSSICIASQLLVMWEKGR